MPIDRKRYDQFREDMTALASGLSMDERMDVVRAKLLDYLARTDVDPNDMQQVGRAVRDLFDPEFQDFAQQVTSSYPAVLAVVNELYADLGFDLTRDFQRIRAIEIANAAQLGAYSDAAVQAISTAVREGLAKEEGVRELAKRIAPASEKAAFFAATLARTQIKVVGRVAKLEKARLAEVPFFEYVGAIRATTRPFCESLVGTTHHIDTIRQMRNGNLEPVEHNCGGWNCSHDWEPDPFAKGATEGTAHTIQEGSSTLVLFGDDDLEDRYEKAKERNQEALKRRAKGD